MVLKVVSPICLWICRIEVNSTIKFPGDDMMKHFSGLIASGMLIGGISLLFLVACSGPPSEIPPGPMEVQFGHDNYIRDVTFHIPKKLRKRRRSLVVCLHDGGSNPEEMARVTRRSFNRLAEEDNFIVAYPRALNGYWNDGRQDSISLSHYRNIDDVGFISKVIDFAADSFKIEEERVYVTGFSEGGLMTFRLACELTVKIDAFAVVAASFSLDQIVECTPDTTISFMMINGTRDPILPFDGGQMMIEGREAGSVLSAEEAINYWLLENGCTEKSVTRDVPNTDTFDETRSERTTWDNCKNKNKIVLIEVINGGHTWPGGRQFTNEKIVGKTSQDFDTAELIWKFFKSL
jgi:polyhydroxybutyrate depolymerase